MPAGLGLDSKSYGDSGRTDVQTVRAHVRLFAEDKPALHLLKQTRRSFYSADLWPEVVLSDGSGSQTDERNDLSRAVRCIVDRRRQL